MIFFKKYLTGKKRKVCFYNFGHQIKMLIRKKQRDVLGLEDLHRRIFFSLWN